MNAEKTKTKKKAMTDDELVRELREFHHYASAARLQQLTYAVSVAKAQSTEDEAIKDLVAETCRRASLVIAVYKAMLDETESFEDEIGADLAYFMGEVLKGGTFQAWLGSNDEFVRALARSFDVNNAVWSFVDLMNDDVDDVFPAHIKAAILAGDVDNLDVGHYLQAAAWVDVLKGNG